MELLLRLAWVAALVSLAQPAPSFLIAAPNIVHSDVAESVAVQVEGGSGVISVTVYFQNQVLGKPCTPKVTFTLNSSNDYKEVKKLKISASQLKQCGIELLKKNKYVQLVAEGPVMGSLGRRVPILVSTKKGYLFIQTDKPIYTPTQNVQFRVFTLDHMMRPTEEYVTISVYNTQGLQVKKVETLSQTSIINDQLTIPDISEPGVWTITAKFTSSPESATSTQFEVKKYVLPNYEVKINPKLPYFSITEEEFHFNVEARYVYGRPVNGVAYVKFGIADEDGAKTFLRGTEKQITLVDGKADVVLTRQAIIKAQNRSLADLKGMNLYIAVTVLETATGALEEQELSTVKFVTSPYVVDLSKTERYFVPGGSHKVLVSVSHTDGSLAAKVPVKLAMRMDGAPWSPPESQTSDDRGVVSYSINTASKARTLEISATVGEGANSETSKFTVSAYQSSGANYLHITAPSGKEVKPGESLSFMVKAITASRVPINYLYYMVLNKGQILFLRRLPHRDVTNIQFEVTGDMIPSFRLVAYYNIGEEMVANSVWLDVEDSCEGQLSVHTNVKSYLKPGSTMKLTIETDGQAQVALAVVDSAVYVLNKKNKLTPNKIFQAMNAYDLGCTVGNGKDFRGVFEDAGLSFISSQSIPDQMYSILREGHGCSSQSRRKKRASDFKTAMDDKLGGYKNPELRRCCQNGMALLPPRMKRTCQQRADKVTKKDCKDVFLECCNFATEQRKKYKRVATGIARKYTEEAEEDYDDEYNILTRTNFPESWLWRTRNVNKKHTETVYLPHSITTWEFQAISMSQGKGFCIAEPALVKVFQLFHIYLRLPYSVKRFEQLEIRPTLYNYAEIDLKMRVFMEKTEGLCSPATADQSAHMNVLVPANSAISVPFSIVPMTKLNLPITVTALGPNGIGDIITKTLMMVREGVTKLEEKTYNLNTDDVKGRSLEILWEEPSNLIPDGDVSISVRVSADISVDTINNSLSADGVSRLIRVPLGCAEQTMIYMAPGVYAMKYLDETEQWTRLSPERRDEALANMNSGYLRLLQFRKPKDGSYGAWRDTPSSTWLTAFIAKILSISRDHIGLDDETILTAAAFLMKQQNNSSGAFKDPAPVWHREMQGGVGGQEGDVSLTAFVTIALHHTLPAHPGEKRRGVRESIEKAAGYLHQKLPSLTRPYAVAITAYALTLVSDDSEVKKNAHTYLMDFVKENKEHTQMYWESKDTVRLHQEQKSSRVPAVEAITVEATSFALMHMLLREDIPKANKIVTWLTEQQNYGGGFKSTQDTVVALEALSKYWIKTYNLDGSKLSLTISSPGRTFSKKILLDKSNNQVEEQLQFSLGNNLHVDVQGKGKGTLKVLRLYNVMKMENTTCQHLKLEVDLTEEIQEDATEDDYGGDYDYGAEAKDEPFARIHWQDLRRRRKREAGQGQEVEKVVLYQVCLWRGEQSKLSGMAIVDITMLSGFVPNLEDLDKLKDLSDRYINHYEYQLGRLLLYFETVPVAKDCITFQATQNVKVGLLQPAAATLYDFYEPDRQCNIFYNLPSRSKLVSALCTGEVCQCAEGPCPQKKRTLDIEESGDPRMNHACYSPRVKYGYKAKVLSSTEQNAFVVYKAQITEVLQQSKDEQIKTGDIRHFIQRNACKMQLSDGKQYLLMGQEGETKDAEGATQYLLESTSWIEELLDEGRCKATLNRSKCNQANKFMESYRSNGCNV